MVAMVEQLKAQESKRVTLEFNDGEVIDAVLLKVDSVEHDDITFDVIRVRTAAHDSPRYDSKNVYVAPIESVARVSASME
jgi:hypothetical protein